MFDLLADLRTRFESTLRIARNLFFVLGDYYADGITLESPRYQRAMLACNAYLARWRVLGGILGYRPEQLDPVVWAGLQGYMRS